MKKRNTIVALIACIAVVCAIAVYKPAGKTKNAEILPAVSELYSDEDLEKAVAVIKQYFSKNFRDCELLKLEYIGDEANSSAQYLYLIKQYGVDEYIVYQMTFKVGNRNNPAYPSDSTQEIKIILGRTGNEEWKYLSSGRP